MCSRLDDSLFKWKVWWESIERRKEGCGECVGSKEEGYLWLSVPQADINWQSAVLRPRQGWPGMKSWVRAERKTLASKETLRIVLFLLKALKSCFINNCYLTTFWNTAYEDILLLRYRWSEAMLRFCPPGLEAAPGRRLPVSRQYPRHSLCTGGITLHTGEVPL